MQLLEQEMQLRDQRSAAAQTQLGELQTEVDVLLPDHDAQALEEAQISRQRSGERHTRHGQI